MEESMQRNDVIREIRKALKARSGKEWSVTGGSGTAWGWITIDAPPRERVYDSDGKKPADGAGGYCSSLERRTELGRLLGLAGPVHCQGESIPASHEHYREYLNRARTGSNGGVDAKPYWD